MRFTSCACSRSCSADCSGRSPGCGPTRVPVGHKLAFGTEKHEDYYIEQGELAARGELDLAELEHLRTELDHLKQRGLLTPELTRVYARLPAPAHKPGAAHSEAGAG